MTGIGLRSTLSMALRQRTRPLTRMAAWSIAEALPALLAGQLTARAVDDGFLAGRPGVGLAWLGLLAGAVLVGAVGTRYAYRCLTDLVEPFRDELAHRVVSAALRQSTTAGARPDHAAVARLTHQVELVRDTFAGLVMVLRAFLFTVVAALLGLLSLAPVIAGLVAVPLLAGLLLFAAALPAMVRRQREYVLADDQLGELAGTVLSGHRDVVACGAQASAAAMVDRPIAAQAAAERALARMAALRSLTLAISGWLPLVVLLSVAPWLVERGLTAGAILGALVYVCTALQPALRALVLGIAGGGLRFAVTMDRILRATDVPWPAAGGVGYAAAGRSGDADGAALSNLGGRAGPSGDTQLGDGRRSPQTVPADRRRSAGQIRCPQHQPCLGAVALHGVTFRYGRAARSVVENLELSLPYGDHLAVVGPSGTGKSTLVTLVAGLLTPQSGTICLNGRQLSGWDPAELARLRVLIPQEAYVFSGTLEENLRYLRPTAKVADIETAIDRVGLRPLADRLGGRTALVEPATLSAGERQLIAATRVYLSPAELVLLDEATGHLDPGAEAGVEHAFAARPGTLVVVAHRISSARRARQVLLLDGDRTVLGSHETLLRDSAAYRELVGVDR